MTRPHHGPTFLAVAAALALTACQAGRPELDGTAGGALFARCCAPCHGPKGGGTKGVPPLAAGKWRDRAPGVQAIVTRGAPGMPAFGELLPAGDVHAVSYYVAERW